MILATAAALLEEQGPSALSLREVARRAGVTHQAPYHHFRDREAIVAALVTDGFDELARRLAAANELAPKQGVRATVLEAQRAYLAFARTRPGLFRIMFRVEQCDPARFPPLREAATRLHDELVWLTRLVTGKAPRPAMTQLLWAQMQGVACLALDGPLAAPAAGADAGPGPFEAAAEAFAQLVLRR